MNTTNGFDWSRARNALAVAIVGLYVIASAAQEPEQTQALLFIPSASDTLDREGFVRVINHSAEAGEVRIDAIDDDGESYGPVVLSVGAGEAVHFNSDDLENGNAEKGLSVGVGPGEGGWRLELSSGLDIEVLSYIRTSDGFVTAMHDTVPSEGGRHWVAFFNPGSNSSQVSHLRLVNPGEEEAEVTITGVDDRGESPGSEVTTTIAAGASRTFTAAALESGGEGLEGALGDGEGKWRLTVESEQPLVAVSLLTDPMGYLTNLSTTPGNAAGSDHFVQFIPSASDTLGRQGFVRVINHSADAGEVSIDAIDDEGGPTVTQGLDPQMQAEGEYRGHPDPHLWIDPLLTAAYVRNIEAALGERYPPHAAEFAERARRYVERLEALDREIASTLAGIERERRKLVTIHDAFRYFGRRYGVEVVATIWGISTEREPSAREIRAIVDGIRKHEVRVVFVETTVNPALMLRIAQETGIHVGAPLFGDSVGPPGSSADTYLGMMRANTRAVAEGLREGWET